MEDRLLVDLRDVFREVFNAPTLDVHPGLTLLDIENFDSLKRIELMVSVESAFHVRLKSSEMSKVEHVSTLIELLRAKLGDQKG